MRFCGNCGTQMDDNAQFCPACGSAQEVAQAQPAYEQPQQNQQQGYSQPGPVYNQTTVVFQQGTKVSDWDGGVLDTIVTSIVASLMITFTCGIATPWAICHMWKFILEHAIVDGKRLTFDGNGAQLLGNWIKWLLLTVITCGIYSFWVTPRLYKWIVSHTHVQQ